MCKKWDNMVNEPVWRRHSMFDLMPVAKIQHVTLGDHHMMMLSF